MYNSVLAVAVWVVDHRARTAARSRPLTESVRADAGLGQGGRRQAARPAGRSVPSIRADVQLLVRYRMLVTSRQIAGR